MMLGGIGWSTPAASPLPRLCESGGLLSVRYYRILGPC